MRLLRDFTTLKGGQLVECQTDEYRFVNVSAPRRVGDWAQIELLPICISRGRRIVDVILLEAEDGSKWLVQRG